MDAVTCSRVYEPFFTTKPVGHGTGLGLAVTHGIVLAHGGAIRARSTPGEGTTFDVYLPLASGADAEPEDRPPTVALPAGLAAIGHGENIMYIDDDEVMSLMVERLLTRAGYAVTCFSDPADALSAFRKERYRYACAVTDFNMPLHSGLDVVQMLRVIVPTLPVVLTSGSVTDALRARARQMQVTFVLEKQNTLEELPGTIRIALDNEGVGNRHREI
jgi:CheY-like chemotaxis protein